MYPVTNIIMLSGYLRSGKDTVGAILVRDFNFTRYAFADALKDEVAELNGLDRTSLDTQEGKSVEITPDTTVRTVLIQHGQTQRARNPNYWVEKVIAAIERDADAAAERQHHQHDQRQHQHDKRQHQHQHQPRDRRIVITDWRFENEWKCVKDHFATKEKGPVHLSTWRIARWNQPPLLDLSETALDAFSFDAVIDNSTDLITLEATVKHRIYGMETISLNILLTDVDDVLLKWIDGFRAYLTKAQKGYRFASEYPTDWNMRQWIKDTSGSLLPDNVVLGLIAQFNASAEFGNLTPYVDAVLSLSRIAQRGYHIIAISSCTDVPEAVKLRRNNIQRHFGTDISYILCLSLGYDKKEALSHFRSSLWIDDKPGNVIAGTECGHTSVLMRRPWNRSALDMKTVSGWREVENLLDKIEELSS